MVMYKEIRPICIWDAIRQVEKSGTSLWGLTTYDVFARTANKECFIVCDDNYEVCGVVIMEKNPYGYEMSLLSKVGFNPKMFLNAWKFIVKYYFEEKIGNNSVDTLNISTKIDNLHLQKIAKRFGFKRKKGRFEFGKTEYIKTKNKFRYGIPKSSNS
jgi:hypothetical protein